MGAQIPKPCQSQETDAKTEVSGDAPVSRTVCDGEVPMWKLMVDQEKAAEARVAILQAEEALRQAELAAEKEEAEAAAKVAAEEAAEAKAREKAASKETKASSSSSAKKRAASSDKEATKKQEKAEAKEAAAAAAATATEEAEARAEVAKAAKLDKAKVKEIEAAFKKRPAKEQQELGAQLREAAKTGKSDTLTSLLEAQGVITGLADKDGWTALMEAAQAGHAGCCSLLIAYGADTKATIKLGEWGMTALHYAARNGHLEAAQVLVPESDLTIKNFNGKTVSDVAKAGGFKEIYKITKVKDSS
ncbi:unnamed protein product [Polarella glacialis]|uniref:Uncharacterized protein n=1 Tax=Polarella glacialis TaxID=89957 RepID=A0A813IYV5_POLGL|nr:unnamed protein product [Polarella glacialis]